MPPKTVYIYRRSVKRIFYRGICSEEKRILEMNLNNSENRHQIVDLMAMDIVADFSHAEAGYFFCASSLI